MVPIFSDYCLFISSHITLHFRFFLLSLSAARMANKRVGYSGFSRLFQLSLFDFLFNKKTIQLFNVNLFLLKVVICWRAYWSTGRHPMRKHDVLDIVCPRLDQLALKMHPANWQLLYKHDHGFLIIICLGILNCFE